MSNSSLSLEGKRVLIIDDDTDLCLLLERYLVQHGCLASTAFNAKKGLENLSAKQYDLVLTDYRLPDMDGLEVIHEVKKRNRNTQIIVITGYSDVRLAIESIKSGAYDYVTKPIQPEEILNTMREALEQSNTGNQPPSEGDQGSANPASDVPKYVEGDSPAERKIQQQISLLAPTNMSVLILGETGTGKEVVARKIHAGSKRAKRPFVAIDCGALPNELASSELFGHVKGAFTGALFEKKGSFEMANGGTLFLDEIGNLSYENQVKLLRAIQEKEIKRLGDKQRISVDVRILAATNDSLKESIQRGEFREDLYFRLNEFELFLSPLRERGKDLVRYTEFFLAESNRQLGTNVTGVNAEVYKCFELYHWPGNLREIKNVIKRSALLTREGEISLNTIPAEIRRQEHSTDTTSGLQQPDLKAAAEHAEKRVIERVLIETNYNKTKTAEILNIDRKTLYNKISAYGIST